MKLTVYRKLLPVFTLLLLAGIPWAFAGSKQDDAARYYEDALKRFEQDDTAGAIVQLKNALQQDPTMLTARVLLGKAYLRQVDPASAEQELTRALQLGVARSEVIVPLAQALLGQGKNKELLDRYFPDGLPAPQRVELLLARGQAYRALGDAKSALRSYRDAAALDPSNVPALLAQADLLASQGNQKDARALIDRAVSLAPSNASAWRVKAGVAQAAGNVEAALAAYSKSLALDPAGVDARVGRATLLIAVGRDEEAAADIQYLQRESPKEPRGNYLRAVYLARKGDNAGTRSALQQITQALDPVPRTVLKQQAPPLLMIGALAHYGLGEAEKARTYLQDYLTIDPGNPGARKLLGSILFAQGDINGAIAMLEMAQRVSPSDPQVLSLLAVAQMARKRYRVAERYLQQALQASGGNADVHAMLGFSLLGIGQRELALDHLRQAFAKDPGQYRAGAALAVLYLRQNQPKDAVAIAEAVVKRDPSNVFVLNLLGVARAASGDRSGARTAYLKAIAVDKAFTSAQLNLGKLDLADGDQAAARAQFLSILKSRPKDTQAMSELAEVEVSAHRIPEAVRWLEKAHDLDRRDTRVTTRLVELQLSSNHAEEALNAAKETDVASPDDLDALAALGRAYLGVGNTQLASASFERMEILAGADVGWQYRIAAYHIDAGDLQAAARCLNKALSGQPDYWPAQILLAEVEIQRGELASAEQRAKAIIGQYPNRGIGKRLLGDIALAKKNYTEAIAAYRAALATESSTDGAIRLFSAYVQSGSPEKGTQYLGGWVQAHPDDAIAVTALAEGYLRGGDLAAARSWYEQLLKIGGEQQPSVLNNLANILLQQQDAGALSYAQRAYALAPNDAAVLDTLGWVLVQQNDPERGLRYLREARLRGPRLPEIRYHLAVALSQTGHADEARAELDPIMAAETTFDGSDDARKLWLKLSGR